MRSNRWYAATCSRETLMPQVIVYVVEGRTANQNEALMKAITEAVAVHLCVAASGVFVQIVESNSDSKSLGGIRYSKMK